jgi:hypothetical protein
MSDTTWLLGIEQLEFPMWREIVIQSRFFPALSQLEDLLLLQSDSFIIQ